MTALSIPETNLQREVINKEEATSSILCKQACQGMKQQREKLKSYKNQIKAKCLIH